MNDQEERQRQYWRIYYPPGEDSPLIGRSDGQLREDDVAIFRYKEEASKYIEAWKMTPVT